MLIEIIKRIPAHSADQSELPTYALLITVNGYLVDRELKREEYLKLLYSDGLIRKPNQYVGDYLIETWEYKTIEWYICNKQNSSHGK